MKDDCLKNVLPIACIVFAVSLLGFYAAYLNKIYYAYYGPFYDSMSYMNYLAKFITSAQQDGVIKALKLSLQETTVFFPWLVGILISGCINLTRDIGVLIQMPLVFTQVITAYFYFKKVPCYSNSVSIVFSLIVVTFAGVFFYNGGLSDLRMDLSQCLAFGSAIALFSIAHETREQKFWVLFGIMLGISFLVRATTPVYAILVFGACALVDAYFFRHDIKRWLVPYLIAALVASAESLWFYVINFDYLHYYYFVWNYDANASLPLSQSIKHVDILFFTHLGKTLCFFLLAVLIYQVFARFFLTKDRVLNLNWVMLLAAIIPIAFLVYFGAALNPFVSMISVPGVIMFSLAPFKSIPASVNSRNVNIAYIVFAIIVIAITSFKGIENHKIINSPYTPSIDGVKSVSAKIAQDMQYANIKDAKFSITYVGGLDNASIINSLTYDHKFTIDEGFNAAKDGLKLKGIKLGLANPVEWAKIEGISPQDKLNTLLNELVKTADYLIMPEDKTKFIPDLPISPYAFAFRNLLIDSKFFIKISEPISISSSESISIYRNISK